MVENNISKENEKDLGIKKKTKKNWKKKSGVVVFINFIWILTILTALLTALSLSVLKGLQHVKPAHRFLAVAIDISKTVNTASRWKLVAKILDTHLPPQYKR